MWCGDELAGNKARRTFDMVYAHASVAVFLSVKLLAERSFLVSKFFLVLLRLNLFPGICQGCAGSISSALCGWKGKICICM